MVTSAQASTADVFGLRQRLAQVEGENTRLKGQLSHAEVRVFVVTDQPQLKLVRTLDAVLEAYTSYTA